jgi:ribosomal protein L11 methyltransferase
MLRAFFADVVDPRALDARVRAYLASLALLGFTADMAPALTGVADRDWNAAWREHFRPLVVGRRLLVAPPWDVPAASDRLVLVIEPGRAFGTGHHGTTAGCLTLLERALDHARVEAAIDLGTGSGILAIAAARLGVPRILAIDDDPDAVAAAATNAARNGVALQLDCRREDAGALDAEPAPLVVANLLTAAHVRLAARYRRLVAERGTLILGGILDVEAETVRAPLRAHDLTPVDALSIDGWTTLEFRAPVHDRA